VEVLPPPPPPDTVPVSSASAVESPAFVAPSSPEVRSQSSDDIAGVEAYLGVWREGSSNLRAWGSMGLVGLLVGWVAVSR
jgi:hypothetical protein